MATGQEKLDAHNAAEKAASREVSSGLFGSLLEFATGGVSATFEALIPSPSGDPDIDAAREAGRSNGLRQNPN